jgi:hypothetical protein
MAVERVMVLLVGGRPVPNVAGVLRYRPQRVAWLASEDALETYRLTRQVLERVPGLVLEEPRVVPAYDLEANRAACEALVQDLREAEVVFNLTCGTKVMALAAYEVAGRHGHTSLYLDTAGGQDVVLCGSPVELAPPDPAVTGSLAAIGQVDVVTYLAVYGRQVVLERLLEQLPVPEDRAVALAQELVAVGPGASGELNWILHHHPEREPLAIRTRNNRPLRGELVLLLQRLRDERWISDLVMHASGRLAFYIVSNTARRFLSGAWLEAYVYQQARNSNLFDDCLMGLNMPGGGVTNEVDVAAIRSGRLLVCSCKTGQRVFQDTAELDKLRAVTGMIGGRYVAKLLVTNQGVPPQRSRAFRSYKNWKAQAAQRQIVVVTGEQLAELVHVLAKETTEPAYRSI